MDIDLAKTFLEIARTGSFNSAAEHLHVTQTTVTVRVRNLESQLGCRLFVRNRAGAKLTSDGERFLLHANQLVRTWEAARRELPLPQGSENILNLGGEITLWNPVLVNWLVNVRQTLPNTAVRLEVGERKTLHEKLSQGLLDAALVHQPDYWAGMHVEELFEEKLVMVESTAYAEPYIYVDWGENFCQLHDAALPQYSRASVKVSLGPLALQYLLQQGGSGYFRTRVIQPYLETQQIRRVDGAPEFSYPIYLVRPRDSNSRFQQDAVNLLKQSIETSEKWI